MFTKPQGRENLEKNKKVQNPALAKKGPAMAAPNQRQSLLVNNRRALGDIGNLAGDLHTRCHISKDGVPERFHLQGPNIFAKASSSTSQLSIQSQAEAVVVRPEGRAEARAVWGSKQKRSMRRKGGLPDAPQNIGFPVPGACSVEASSDNAEFKTARRCKLSKHSQLTMTATLTARSESASMDFEEPLPDIDQYDVENQLAVAEYVTDIYKFYKSTEALSCVPKDYITKQTELNDRMRAILIDWLTEVHLKFELMPETLYLTVNIVDRYLSKKAVSRSNLQLVGVTAMLIASKYEEIWAPEINDFVSISANEYSGEQIRSMERKILRFLKFQLTVPTPYVFLIRFLKAATADKETENVAFFLTELSLVQYTMIKYSPSMIAASAVYTALCTMKKKEPHWDKLLVFHTGYTEAELRECAHRMVELHANAAASKLKAVFKKYSDPCYGAVARLTPANLPADDTCSCSN